MDRRLLYATANLGWHYALHTVRRLLPRRKRSTGIRKFQQNYLADGITCVGEEERHTFPGFQRCIACEVCLASCELNALDGVAQLPKGYDERYAWMDVKAELDRIRENVAEAAEQVRTLEAERLDKLFLAMYTQASKGNQGAVDRCLRIMERRAKLYGLDTPSKHEVTGADGNELNIIVRYVDSND